MAGQLQNFSMLVPIKFAGLGTASRPSGLSGVSDPSCGTGSSFEQADIRPVNASNNRANLFMVLGVI